MTYNNITDHLSQIVPKLVASLPAAFIVIIGALLIRFALSRAMNVMTRRTRVAYSELSMVRKVLNWFIVCLTVILLLGIFGFNLGGLWTVVSTMLAMVAIGFVAVWSVLSNVSCTFMILLFRPFGIGDEIEFAGEEIRGRVIDLNLLYTTLEIDETSTMQIPNNLFFQKAIKRRKGASTTSLIEQLRNPSPAED